MQQGVESFLRDMAELGIETSLDAELVIYRVAAVDGDFAGVPIDTGVSIPELDPWPQVPPHWLHFPDSISFRRTNSSPSPKPGWLMHSRQISGWGDAPTGIAWVSHLRAVLSDAIQ